MRAAALPRACNITQRRVAIGYRHGAHGRFAALWASTVTVHRRLDFRPWPSMAVHGLLSVELPSTAVHGLSSRAVHGLLSVGLPSIDFCLSDFRPWTFICRTVVLRTAVLRPYILASYALLSGALCPTSMKSYVLSYCNPVSCVLHTVVVHRVVLCPAAYLVVF
jgi:hypothetical protein